MLILELSDNQKIILFELLHKLEEQNDLHEADKKLVSDLIAALEEKLVEPFSPDYQAILELAQSRILSE